MTGSRPGSRTTTGQTTGSPSHGGNAPFPTGNVTTPTGHTAFPTGNATTPSGHTAFPTGPATFPTGNATAPTGFCRVTVVAPDSRIDVALPQDVAAADVYPEILRLTGRPQPPGTPTGYHLFRLDGTVLDGARTLAEQRVLDGELLTLRPFARSLPPAVFDDVADAVASAVTRDRRLWNGELLRAAGLGAGVLLLALLGLVLWYAEPVRHDMHGLPGIVAGVLGVLLTTVAAVRARVYEDGGSAVAVGLGALPLLMIAGSGIVGPHAGEGPGRLQFLLGCVTVLVASTILVALLPSGDAPFVAAVLLAATGTLASFAMILTGATATSAAAVCAPAAIALIAFLPALSARFARLPIGYTSPRTATDPYRDPDAHTPHHTPIDADRIAARARRGHELLLGLAGGCAATVTASAAFLSLTGGTDALWPRLLTLAAGLALLLRARLFRYTTQVACVLAAGLGAIALLVLGLALDVPAHQPQIHTIWLSTAVAAGAALLTAIALIVPTRGVSPFWSRATDLTESLTLLTLIPLSLATLDLYESARSLTS